MTRPADADYAAAAGASYLGVVLASGPRQVDVPTAGAVVECSRGVPVLGVFTAHSVDEIVSLSRRIGLTGAQLHGAYTRDDAACLRAEGFTVWRVLRLAVAADLDRLGELIEAADAVLVEPRVPHADGGAGVVLDLGWAAQARQRLAGTTMVLAGGLTPDTVGAALALVQPEVADVSSGVESLPGLKDHEKIARFLEAVLGRSPTVG